MNDSGNKEPGQTEDGKDTDQYLNVLIDSEPSVLDVARFVGVVDRNIFFNRSLPDFLYRYGQEIQRISVCVKESEWYDRRYFAQRYH